MGREDAVQEEGEVGMDGRARMRKVEECWGEGAMLVKKKQKKKGKRTETSL